MHLLFVKEISVAFSNFRHELVQRAAFFRQVHLVILINPRSIILLVVSALLFLDKEGQNALCLGGAKKTLHVNNIILHLC